MLKKRNLSSRIADLLILCAMLAAGLVCLLPLLNVFAISLSSNIAVSQGAVSFWPVGLTLTAYEYLLKDGAFWKSMGMSVFRVILGVMISMVLLVLSAYPLSLAPHKFPKRKYYTWFFMFAMLFSGGLIPTFMVVQYTGLINTIWALVIPGAVPIYNLILMLNFFRQLPAAVSEAAYIDGAGHLTTLIKVILPMSKPVLATIALFVVVAHWNEWFSPIIYMRNTDMYPMQTYLQSKIISNSFQVTSAGDLDIFKQLSNKTVNSAQIFVGMIPILCVYPFLQKYFTQGIVLGSVKE